VPHKGPRQRLNRRSLRSAALSFVGQLEGTRGFGSTDPERVVGDRYVTSRIEPVRSIVGPSTLRLAMMGAGGLGFCARLERGVT
jgi:hypothetical protein